MDYNFSEIEKKWQEYWRDNKIYQVEIDKNKPKFYVLDMFPYPSFVLAKFSNCLAVFLFRCPE